MRVLNREDLQVRERETLSPDAAFAEATEGRDRSAGPDALRTDYQRLFTPPTRWRTRLDNRFANDCRRDREGGAVLA